MVEIVTPSTGARREGGDLRLNVLRIAPPDRVLFRTSFGGWQIAECGSTGELGITLTRDGRFFANAAYREIAGVVAAGVDEDAFLANLVALEKHGDAEIAAARKAKADALRVLLDCGDLDRSNVFIPGL